MFSPGGPSLRELTVQALSSVERGYDLLAPKFDRTPFRTSDAILDATAAALCSLRSAGPLGPFERGLDLCCGTGAGLRVLRSAGCGQRTGTDVSAGMLTVAAAAEPDARLVRADARALPFAAEFDLAVSFGALGHFLPSERPALFAGVRRALRPGGVFAVPVGLLPPWTSAGYWALLGFDAALRVRNAVRRPPFVMYYLTCPPAAIRRDLAAAGFAVSAVALGPRCELVLGRR